MKLFANISIRYKLFLSFFLTCIVFLGFVGYFIISFNLLTQSFRDTNNQFQKLQLFLTLDVDNKELSNAVKLYILTKQDKWQNVYDQTTTDLSQIIAKLKTISQGDELLALSQFENITNKTKGTELLILSTTRDGNTEKAINLFDTIYEKNQEQATELVSQLVKDENSNFSSTLDKGNQIVQTTRNIIAAASIIILLVFAFIGFSISSTIEGSLKKLLAYVNQISSGDLQARVPINSHDEIGTLSTAFNAMAQQLQESYQGLEQKIQEKTQQLSENVADLENTKQAMLNVMEDVQEEKQLAERERAKDDAILGSIGDATLAIDPQGKILFVNSAAEQLLSITDNEVIGRRLFETFQLYDETGRVIPQESRPFSLTLLTGQKTSQTYSYMKKDKSTITINITATPIKQKDQIIGVIEIIRDITKEKQVDRMKTEFISLASHQLRTPLSAIRWFSDMLLGGDAGPLTPEQKDFAKNISDSTQRMIDLVNSLLNISRIESGRIVIDPKPTDLKKLVDDIVVELQVKIQERQQTLVVSAHGDLPQINVDPKLIRQVYMNLLTNAIKYTPKGGDINVFISKKDDEIISQVSDNGYGIPKGQQDKIFQKFFRAENVVKVETDGTGLGLYLIKAIIESSHGKIWFTSEENKGTSFFFSLPVSGMQAKAGEVTLDG